MYGTCLISLARKLTSLLAVLLCLTACGHSDKPFGLDDGGPTTPGGPPTPPGGAGCFVNFKSQMQLKISANPAGDPLEVLDANPVDVAPIPIRIEGSKVTLGGDGFPEIILTRLSEQADLRIKGLPGAEGLGIYNPDSGEITIENFKFSLEILTKGTTELFLPGSAALENINFITGSVTATGNLNSITETGKPLNKEDKSLSLVIGITLPSDFGALSVLNTMIGGGALTAKFDGHLDATPETCSSGTPGGFPGVVDQPPGLKIAIEDQASTGEIDFGASAAVLKTAGGKQVIDCLEAGNRALVARRVTITNTGDVERTIRFGQPYDSDFDRKAPLCGGQSEFVRGAIVKQGAATCKATVVAGRSYPIGDCTIPPGSSENAIVFPLMYLPFNFEAPAEGQGPILDQGVFFLDHGGESTFPIKLKGYTLPDFRDVFHIVKVLNGAESLKEIKNKGVIKIALADRSTVPFSQPLVLKNTGGDSWEEISFTFEDGSVFSMDPPLVNRLPAADDNAPGRFEMKLNFKPTEQPVYNDKLTIKMVRVGSITTEAPQGVEAKIVLNLLGTIGLPKLSGEVKLQFDYLTALIDHIALDTPTESIDYRQNPEIAPQPLKIIFKDTAHEDLKEVELQAEVVDILDPALSPRDREKVLRVFTSRASIGKNGERLTSGDGSDKCYEPSSITRPYQGGDCSYFYHNIMDSDVGLYDDESGHFTLPNIQLRMQNPYHADILGKWPASNPNLDPDYFLDAILNMSFTTHILDRRSVEEGGREILLVPDLRTLPGDLVLSSKPLGPDCPEGIFDGAEPNFKCFLSTGNRYLQGKEVTLRPNQTREYDIVLVGVGQFPSEVSDPELPWFLGENGGSRIFIAILGRMYKD